MEIIGSCWADGTVFYKVLDVETYNDDRIWASEYIMVTNNSIIHRIPDSPMRINCKHRITNEEFRNVMDEIYSSLNDL